MPIGDIVAPLQPAAAEATTEELAVEVGGAPVLDPRTGFAVHTIDGQSFDIATRTPLPNAAFFADDPDLQGYAIIDQELEDGLVAASVPLRDSRGTVLAAVNVCGHASHLGTDDLEKRCLPALRDCAQRISRSLV